MTEKGTAQAKETYEKMTAASTEAADLMQKSYLTAVKGVQDYNNKFFEFAHENSNAAFDFIQKVSGVRSPSAFVELSTEHARKQLELLTEQAKQLATLAQKATLATAEPIKTASQRSNSLKLIANKSCGSAHRESHPPCGGEHRDVRGRLINLRLRELLCPVRRPLWQLSTWAEVQCTTLEFDSGSSEVATYPFAEGAPP